MAKEWRYYLISFGTNHVACCSSNKTTWVTNALSTILCQRKSSNLLFVLFTRRGFHSSTNNQFDGDCCHATNICLALIVDKKIYVYFNNSCSNVQILNMNIAQVRNRYLKNGIKNSREPFEITAIIKNNYLPKCNRIVRKCLIYQGVYHLFCLKWVNNSENVAFKRTGP